MIKLINGVGIYDLRGTGYVSQWRDENGKKHTDAAYSYWSNMLKRCYSEEYHQKNPSYSVCEVCNDWKVFSKFKEWFDIHYSSGYHLDKDLMVEGNTIYSADTCVMIPPIINLFMNSDSLPNFTKRNNRYEARCNNPFLKKNEYLGLFLTEDDAHLAWKAKKNEHAETLCQNYTGKVDERVLEVLFNRYK